MRFIVLLTTTLTLLGLSSCAVNPVTGKTELSIISTSSEIAIGRKNYIPYQQQQGGQYTVDPALGQYVNKVGQALAQLSDSPNLPYEFVVLNNSVPNAWALPGGKIAIKRGLLIELEDEAQLAAVLSHEIVHVAGKHGVQKIQQAQLLGLGVLATSLLTQNKDYGQTAMIGANIGAGLWSAKYGRDQELQSDAFGMAYMARAGYEPQAAIELQETFVRLSQQKDQNQWLRGLFASHPPSQERVEQNRQTAAKLGFVGKRNKNAFEQAISQLLKDQEAYDKHTNAIAKAENQQYEPALKLLNEAIAIQPKEPIFHLAQGQILFQQKRDSRAAKAFTTAKKLNPNYFMGYLGLGLIEKKQKRYAQAKQSLLRSQSLLPTQMASYHLGEIELANGNTKEAIRYFSGVSQQRGELGEKAQGHLTTLSQARTNS